MAYERYIPPHREPTPARHIKSPGALRQWRKDMHGIVATAQQLSDPHPVTDEEIIDFVARVMQRTRSAFIGDRVFLRTRLAHVTPEHKRQAELRVRESLR